MLPIFFRFEQCSSAVRYRNANDRIDIYLQFNEDLVFGLLVIVLMESMFDISPIDHLHNAIQKLDKDNVTKAATRWMQKAENITEPLLRQKMTRAVSDALRFCQIDEIPPVTPPGLARSRALATNSTTPPSNPLSHQLSQPAPHHLVRVLLHLVTVKAFDKESEIREYLKARSPRPLPRCFRFEAERYVRYRNSREGINLTLKLNEELIFGLILATMIEKPRTCQFNDMKEDIMRLDRRPLSTVIEKFKDKSENLSRMTRQKVEQAIASAQAFVGLLHQPSAIDECVISSGVVGSSPLETRQTIGGTLAAVASMSRYAAHHSVSSSLNDKSHTTNSSNPAPLAIPLHEDDLFLFYRFAKPFLSGQQP